jgi:hypothetical protein
MQVAALSRPNVCIDLGGALLSGPGQLRIAAPHVQLRGGDISPDDGIVVTAAGVSLVALQVRERQGWAGKGSCKMGSHHIMMAFTTLVVRHVALGCKFQRQSAPCNLFLPLAPAPFRTHCIKIEQG